MSFAVSGLQGCLLTSCRTSEKNRYQNALTVCNVTLDSVVYDIFGKSATSVIDYLIKQSDNSISHEEISARLLRSLKKKSDRVIEGYQMTDSPKYRMHLIRVHLDYITSTINDIDIMLDSLIKMLSSYCVPFRVLTVTVQLLLSPRLLPI